MSCMIISANSLKGVAEYMSQHYPDSMNDILYHGKEYLERKGIEFPYKTGIYYEPSENDARLIFAVCLVLNYNAYCQRYKEKFDTLYLNYVIEHYQNIKFEKLDIFQAYKSLQCLIYQCNEGTVSHELMYEAMVIAMNEYARKIVSSLPEYKNALWG